MSHGIYFIKNIVNNKIYIGSTINFKERWHEHVRLLKKQKHHCLHLQNSWNKYSEKSFIFKRIEIVKSQDNLIKTEQSYLDKYWDGGINCYNICKIAGSKIGVPCTKDTKDKISSSLKKYFNENTKSMVRRKLTNKEKHHLSIINTGKKANATTRKKMSTLSQGTNNNFYGKKHTSKSKIAMCVKHSKLTKEQIIEIKLLLIAGRLTHKEIGKKYEVGSSSITRIKHSVRWKHILIYDDLGNELKTESLFSNKPRNPITEVEAIQIKKLLLLSTISQREIAKMFNVTVMVISNINSGKRWSHIVINNN